MASVAYSVRLEDAGEDPDAVVTVLVEQIDLSEDDAADRVESGGEVVRTDDETEARDLRDALEAAGATVSIAVAEAHELCRVQGDVRLSGGGTVGDIDVRAFDGTGPGADPLGSAK